jgi:hypothetical protein
MYALISAPFLSFSHLIDLQRSPPPMVLNSRFLLPDWSESAASLMRNVSLPPDWLILRKLILCAQKKGPTFAVGPQLAAIQSPSLP